MLRIALALFVLVLCAAAFDTDVVAGVIVSFIGLGVIAASAIADRRHRRLKQAWKVVAEGEVDTVSLEKTYRRGNYQGRGIYQVLANHQTTLKFRDGRMEYLPYSDWPYEIAGLDSNDFAAKSVHADSQGETEIRTLKEGVLIRYQKNGLGDFRVERVSAAA